MIEISSKDLARAAQLLNGMPSAIDQVSKKAVRKAVKGVKREAVQKVTERYTIQKARVGKTMRVTYQGAGAVFSSKGPVNDLSYFKHQPRSVPRRRPPTGQYLYSQVVKGQGGTIAHAFLARMKSGHVGVFRRTAGNASLPIEKLAGPSVPQMLGSPSISEYMEKHLAERLGDALGAEVDAYLGRFGK